MIIYLIDCNDVDLGDGHMMLVNTAKRQRNMDQSYWINIIMIHCDADHGVYYMMIKIQDDGHLMLVCQLFKVRQPADIHDCNEQEMKQVSF